MPEPTDTSLAPIAGLIAVVGCDGTGKSTLTADLLARLKQRGRAERRYMGLISGEMGDKIKDLPWVGEKLEAHLHKKADKAQNIHNKVPGLFASLVMYGLSVWRARHLEKAVKLARSGVVVLTDRYPQNEIPGFHYDGPGLGTGRSPSGLVRRLARREQRLYDRLVRYRPQLLIRLDIDADTAKARKPDHPYAELRDKIAIMARLHFNAAPMVDLDTRAPYPEVLETAWQTVTAVLDGKPIPDSPLLTP